MTAVNPNEVFQVVTPAVGIAGPPQSRWTYAKYLNLPDDGKRYEIIEGVLYLAPIPNFFHQSSNITIAHYLFTHLELTDLGRVVCH